MSIPMHRTTLSPKPDYLVVSEATGRIVGKHKDYKLVMKAKQFWESEGIFVDVYKKLGTTPRAKKKPAVNVNNINEKDLTTPS